MPSPDEDAAVRRAVAAVDAGLAAHADPVRAPRERAYLKSSLDHLGVPVPLVRSTVRRTLRGDAALAGHDAAMALAEALWDSPVHERRLAAVEVLVARAAVVEVRDLPRLERLLRESRTWALVDPLAGNVVGALVLRAPEDPDLWARLERWAVDPDFWLRRSALLSQLGRLTRASTTADDFETFERWADSMLDEREFFVRKAIGWVLREMSKRHPEIVVAYVAPRAPRMSGVTWREAVRRLPPELAARLPARPGGARRTTDAAWGAR